MQINLNIFALNYFIYNFVPLISQIICRSMSAKTYKQFEKKLGFSEEQVSTYLGVNKVCIKKI